MLVTGCTYEMPPPVTPDQLVPQLGELPPVAEGEGRIVLDVADGRTEIRRPTVDSVTLRIGNNAITASAFGTERLCDSPCVMDIAPGRQRLAFPTRGGSGRLEVVDVEVLSTPTVYRRALGSYRTGGAGLVLGILGVVFGGASFATGSTLLPVGLASDGPGLTAAGAITLGVGAALTALGIVAIAASPKRVQPGSAIQFLLPGGAEPEPQPQPEPQPEAAAP